MKKLGALWIITTLAVACTAQDPGGGGGGRADANTCGDGTCQNDETKKSCPADCDKPVCGDNVCDSSESSTSCPADCHTCGNNVCEANEATTCPADCPASLIVQNNSSYTIYNLYAAPCGGAWTSDQTGSSYINPGSSFTLTGIPPGCWSFKASTAGDGLVWTSNPTNFSASTPYTWTLTN